MTSPLGARIRNRGFSTLILRGGALGLLFVMHLLLAQALGAGAYGTFSFAVMLAALLAKAAGLGWPQALVRFVAEYQELKKWGLLRGVIRRAHQSTLLAGLTSACLLTAIAVGLPIRTELREGLLLTAILLPLGALVGIRRSTFQGLHRHFASVIPDEILVPSLLILACLFLSPKSARVAVFLYGGASLAAFGLATVWLIRSLPLQARGFEEEYRTRNWLGTALPMALGGLGFLILNRTDSLMLGWMVDMKTVGLYSAANRFAMLINLVLGSILIVTTPLLSASFHGGRRMEFYALIRWSRRWAFWGSLPLLVLMGLFPRHLLGLFGVEFAAGASLLRILALGQFLSVSAGPVGQALLMSGHQKIAAWVTALVALINGVGNSIVIPYWGAMGAATMTAVSLVLWNGSFWLAMNRLIPASDVGARDRVGAG